MTPLWRRPWIYVPAQQRAYRDWRAGRDTITHWPVLHPVWWKP